MTADCKHAWVRLEAGDECAHCHIPWADAMRGFGSKQQPLSGRVKRVPRK